MVGGLEVGISLSQLSEGVPSAPFSGYSGTDLRLDRGGEERWTEEEGTDGDSAWNSWANTLGVGTLGIDTLGVCILGIDTLGVCTLGGVGVGVGVGVGDGVGENNRKLAPSGVST